MLRAPAAGSPSSRVCGRLWEIIPLAPPGFSQRDCRVFPLAR
jgi:hypothetical protein